MSDGLDEHDMEAVKRAIGILQTAGYRVSDVGHVSRDDSGVVFSFTAHGETTSPDFDLQSEAVAQAAKDAREVGTDGEPEAEDGGGETDG